MRPCAGVIPGRRPRQEARGPGRALSLPGLVHSSLQRQERHRSGLFQNLLLPQTDLEGVQGELMPSWVGLRYPLLREASPCQLGAWVLPVSEGRRKGLGAGLVPHRPHADKRGAEQGAGPGSRRGRAGWGGAGWGGGPEPGGKLLLSFSCPVPAPPHSPSKLDHFPGLSPRSCLATERKHIKVSHFRSCIPFPLSVPKCHQLSLQPAP